ncbi:arylesterase [Pedobacter gandavensis]|uniref:Arylesterase n=1 Tax=Pedobacter gandavensis TaxID=2679963 RepID=A0ABR6ERA0_9SPHI|nr:arylesterase [Pedobacter gandavensis]MBB2147784.1 arylesterase [Pedobacter gandavensis]
MLQSNFKGSFVLMFMFSAMALFSSCAQNQGSTDTSGKTEPDTSSKNKIAAQANTSTTAEREKTILCFGTSLTAGYGLQVNEAFPALIQQKIKEVKLPYKVVNAGLSGETSAAGNTRIDWLLKQPIDILVLELGANDGLRGIPLSDTRSNLQQITDKVRKKYPEVKIVLAGMQIPPSMGAKYANEFKSLFPELARKNDMILVPFLLQGVAGIPELNQKDGIHPTVAGQKILAENVWAKLKPIL